MNEITKAVDEPITATFDATREQIDIIQHPSLIKIAVCGRRWGKTIMMAIYLATVALMHANCTVWYVSPRYARSMKMMRIMKKCKPFMELVADVAMQFPPRFEMKNGAEICFISADREDELRGEGLKLICVDETSILTPHLFYEVLLPMTMDGDGTILAGSTYNGRNWFYDLAHSGQIDSVDVKTWVHPTSSGMKFKGERGLERLARFKAITPPAVWKQECECEPMALIDAVFMYVDQCIIPGKEDLPIILPMPIPGMQYVVAQDIGKEVDPSGVVVQELASGKTVYIESYGLHTLHKVQAQRTAKLQQHFNYALVCLDTTGGASGGKEESHIKEYAKVIKHFQSVTFTVDTKRSMVGLLELELQNMKTSIPAHFKELIAQLKLYRSHFSEKAILPTFFGRPDDLVSAMMMCSYARSKRWTPPNPSEYAPAGSY